MYDKILEEVEGDSDLNLKAKIVVLLIAKLERPAPDPKNLKEFNDEVNKWAVVLESIWCRSENPQDAMFASLLVVYEAISTEGTPNSSLASVLQLVPTNLIVLASRALVLAPGSTSQGLTKTLQALCDWLIVAPKATHLPIWIKALVDALCRDGKSAVVTEVASNVVERLISVLHLHFLRPGALAALQCLIGYSHPSIIKDCIEDKLPAQIKLTQIFHPGLNSLPLINKLQLENSPSSTECIKWLTGVQQIGASFPAQQKVGLINLGNTCYMNSVLQALFLSNQFCADILAATCAPARPVSCRLQELFALLRFSRRPAIAPRDLMFISRPPGFSLGEQQDSSEFLIHLLDTIHEEENNTVNVQESDSSLTSVTLKRTRSRSLSPTAGISETVDLRKIRSADEILSLSVPFKRCRKISKFNGLTQRSFGGKMQTIVRCFTCFSESLNIDPFIDIHLSFPRQCRTPQTIQNLVDIYFKPEILTGENRYKCDKCKKLCDAQRTLQMVEAPPSLIFTVKLFGSNPPTKLAHRLSYTESIRLPGNIAYTLYAAVVHYGSTLHSGHYLTYASDSNAEWHLYDDDLVMPSSFAELSRCVSPRTPYVLFFKRSTAPPLDMFQTPAQLPMRLRELVARDNAAFTQGQRDEEERRRRRNAIVQFKDHRRDDDDNNPPSNCGGGSGSGMPPMRFTY